MSASFLKMYVPDSGLMDEFRAMFEHHRCGLKLLFHRNYDAWREREKKRTSAPLCGCSPLNRKKKKIWEMRTKENAECEILYVSWCIHVSVYKETSRNLISIVLWVCDKLADSKFVCLVHIRVYPHRNSKLTLDVCNSACLCITLPVSRVQPVSNILWMFTCFIISDNQFFTCVIRASSSQNFPYVHLHRRTSTYAFVMFFPHTCTYRNTWR